MYPFLFFWATMRSNIESPQADIGTGGRQQERKPGGAETLFALPLRFNISYRRRRHTKRFREHARKVRRVIKPDQHTYFSHMQVAAGAQQVAGFVQSESTQHLHGGLVGERGQFPV